MSWTLDSILRRAREDSASDVHLVRGVAPAVRIGGDIHLLRGEPLHKHDLEGILEEMQRQRRPYSGRAMATVLLAALGGRGPLPHSIYFHAGCPELSIRLCEIRVVPATIWGCLSPSRSSRACPTAWFW